MRRFLFIASLFLVRPALASTDVNVVGSSFTYSGVNIGTGTVQLVDNYIGGVQVSTSSFATGINNSTAGVRIGIELQNLDAANAIWCGYNINVSSTTSGATSTQNNNVGFRIKSGEVRLVGLGDVRTRYYCIAADAAAGNGVWVHEEWIYKQ